MRNTQESLKTVPQSYREGAFGLGAGFAHTMLTFPHGMKSPGATLTVAL